jgi:hypothetical protein
MAKSKKTLPRQNGATAVVVEDEPEVNELDAVGENPLAALAASHNDEADENDYVHNIGVAVIARATLSDDVLGQVLENALTLSFSTLKMCEPLVKEMRARFRKLPRGKQKDGTYKTIRGCRTFQDWCNNVLHRSEQAVYLMLRQKELPAKPAPPAAPVMPKEELPKVLAKVGKEMPPAPLTIDDAVSSSISYILSTIEILDLSFKRAVLRTIRKDLGYRLTGKWPMNYDSAIALNKNVTAKND